MTADLVARLAQEIRRVDGSHSLGAGALAEALAPFVEREAASALRSSGEAVAWTYRCRDARDRAVIARSVEELRGNIDLYPETWERLHPLYLHPATPASAWRPIAEGWALVFSDPRDFCASASALIGATYSDPDAAARRFANKSLRGEGMVWGDILAFAPTPPTSTKGG